MSSKQCDTSKPRSETLWRNIIRWVDSEAVTGPEVDENSRHINWVRCLPFFFVHAMCLGVIWVGISPVAVVACLFFFWALMLSFENFGCVYCNFFMILSFKIGCFGFRVTRRASFVLIFCKIFILQVSVIGESSGLSILQFQAAQDSFFWGMILLSV